MRLKTFFHHSNIPIARMSWLLCAMLVTLCVPAAAQQPKKVPRIGVLVSGSRSASVMNRDAFRQRLREFGYVDKENIVVEYRYAEGDRDRLPKLASELVQLKVDVVVASGTQSTMAAKQATGTIPIIVGAAGDLVGSGLVASLSRPGGNITGSTVISPELSGKRVELLKEAVSKLSRVAVLLHSGSGTDRNEVREMEQAAQSLKVKIQIVEVQNPTDFQASYAAMRRENAEALILIQSSFTSFHRKQLADLAAKSRLTTMCETARWTEDGCVMSYGPDLPYLYQRAAVYVDKILKGAKPAELPVERPTKFELIINLKAAKVIGLTIPQWLLVRADRVIK